MVAVIALVVGGVYATSRYLLKSSQATPLTCSSGALPYTTSQDQIGQQTMVQRQVIQQPVQSPSSSTIQVVAGENFWGSLISQLGGNRTSVLSIVSDPNADPHEYESNTQNAIAIANANLVIVNGAGYDNWATNLIQANPSSGRTVLNVADLLGKVEGDNPHFWYSPSYVNTTVHQMYLDLVSIDPPGSSYYSNQYASLNSSLAEYNGRINEIAANFADVRVASTESIFEYLAAAAHLNLISPPAFMSAVAEGNDPSPGCIALFQSQLLNPNSAGNATVLVYNAQTVTPLTEQIKAEAAQNKIPTVAVTETVQPSDVKFQVWMNAELITLQNALNANAIGQ